ncbi:PREDICTED: prostamide/prostaglandin F synthase-like isoform X1 [Papilio xuthus]|uniref:Prostamide/prostaglandin F synthase n=1 Tax=Papilio xuthus TaxID=66420 RepID=A0AAJ6ZSM0_PAPXU|nr:PREDICTED: prostamide/prostaglandin F synthase-like isoform X1 [Papilio xuthus]
MSVDINVIGSHKIRSIPGGEQVELKTFWQDQDAVVIFFRRWGCMLCRLWAKELSEIAPVLKKNNIKLVGIGVENAGSKEFLEGKFFDGELYHVDDISTYHTLGFKRFNVVSIITSLFWKQSREAIAKGRGMGLGGDYKGDWVQTGGALLVEKGGNVIRHFVQTGPGDHLNNKDILKHFNLEAEYKEETMANKVRDNIECNKPSDKLSVKNFLPFEPIHVIWCSRRCKQTKV